MPKKAINVSFRCLTCVTYILTTLMGPCGALISTFIAEVSRVNKDDRTYLLIVATVEIHATGSWRWILIGVRMSPFEFFRFLNRIHRPGPNGSSHILANLAPWYRPSSTGSQSACGCSVEQYNERETHFSGASLRRASSRRYLPAPEQQQYVKRCQ